MFFKTILNLSVCAALFVPLPTFAAKAGQEYAPLTAFIVQTWQNNPALQAANTAISAAKARQQGASRPLYNPDLAFDAERTDINTFSVGVSQTLDWANKRSSLSDIAQFEVGMAENQRQIMRRQITIEVVLLP